MCIVVVVLWFARIGKIGVMGGMNLAGREKRMAAGVVEKCYRRRGLKDWRRRRLRRKAANHDRAHDHIRSTEPVLILR